MKIRSSPATVIGMKPQKPPQKRAGRYGSKRNESQETSRNVGFDETSSKRRHDYVSVFVDLDTSKVVFATEGKD